MQIITPQNKPIIEDSLFCYLFLEENEVDYSKVESRATKEGFRKQTRRHVTILGRTMLMRVAMDNILSKFSEEEKGNVLKEIKNILESLEWKYEQKDVYLIKKEGVFDDSGITENRQSYISVIDMPDMDIFYEKINKLLKANIPTQFPHITLFTKGEKENPQYHGIAIPSVEEFNKLDPKRV